MSDTQQAAPAGPGDARIIEPHHAAHPAGEDVLDAIDHRGRRRYYVAPQPCRDADAGRSGSTWMVLVWLTAIVLIAFPLPWWW